MKAVVAAFNQEKALVGAFSVITNLRMDLFEALLLTLLQYAAIGSSCVPPSLQPSHHTSLPIIISHSDAISPQFGDDRVAAWAVLQPGRDKLISQRLLETAISIIS